jgi:hypothetical protein
MGENDLNDLRVEQFRGADVEPPVHELAEILLHDVKIEQEWMGWLLQAAHLQRRGDLGFDVCTCGKGNTRFLGIRRR